MKIVDRATFLAMPVGTVYRKVDDSLNFEDLEIKTGHQSNMTETTNGDWVSLNMTDVVIPGREDADHFSIIDEVVEGAYFYFDPDGTGRDGLYDREQLFAVYDRNDLLGLINVLTESLSSDAYPTVGDC